MPKTILTKQLKYKQVVVLDEVRKKAKKDYMSGLKYKEICEKYNLSINTLKSWIKRYNWASEKKKGAHKKKKGAPKGNKNAVGNDGGAPLRNKNAGKHGFFSKYLPEETLGIMQEIKEKDPLDILWENITIQYAAIVRAQKIMYVTEKEEMIKELKRSKVKSYSRTTSKTTSKSSEEEYEFEFQFAWDRQATFLKAQSRAMAELRNMIAKYDELLRSSLATEEQKLRIEKLKAEIAGIKGTSEEGQDSINEFIDATTLPPEEVTELFEGEDDADIQE